MQQRITVKEVVILSIVGLLGFSGLMGLDIHLASLPFIMRFMHTNQAEMQHSVSLFLFGMGLSILVYGPLSDKFGRKIIVIIGLLIASTASFASVFTSDITPFLVTRFLQGVGSGVCMGLGRTIAADILQGVRLAQVGSYFSMLIGLSPLLAPPLGGYLQAWFSWQANFIFLGCFLLMTLLLFALFCPETNQFKVTRALKVRAVLGTYWSLLTHPLFMMATMTASFAMTAIMVYATLSSFIFQNSFHLTPIEYGWVTMLVGVSSIVGKFCTPIILRVMGAIKGLALGLWCFLMAGIWIAGLQLIHLSSVSNVMIGVVIVMFALSLIMPIVMSFALSPFHDKRGAAGSIYAALPLLFAFGFTSLLSVYTHMGVMMMGMSYTVLSLSGLLIFYFGFRPKIKELESSPIVSNYKA